MYDEQCEYYRTITVQLKKNARLSSTTNLIYSRVTTFTDKFGKQLTIERRITVYYSRWGKSAFTHNIYNSSFIP